MGQGVPEVQGTGQVIAALDSSQAGPDPDDRLALRLLGCVVAEIDVSALPNPYDISDAALRKQAIADARRREALSSPERGGLTADSGHRNSVTSSPGRARPPPVPPVVAMAVSPHVAEKSAVTRPSNPLAEWVAANGVAAAGSFWAEAHAIGLESPEEFEWAAEEEIDRLAGTLKPIQRRKFEAALAAALRERQRAVDATRAADSATSSAGSGSSCIATVLEAYEEDEEEDHDFDEGPLGSPAPPGALLELYDAYAEALPVAHRKGRRANQSRPVVADGARIGSENAVTCAPFHCMASC